MGLQRRTTGRRPVSLGPEQLRELAEAWAKNLFSPLAGSHPSPEGWPGRETRAVLVQTEDRDDDRSASAQKLRLARNTAVRQAIAEAGVMIGAGDIDAAKRAVSALREQELPAVHWCETVEELTPVLVDCLAHGEQCCDSGPVDGPAGRVIWMFVWYDPSHPVGGA
jgi:hypothetical protein